MIGDSVINVQSDLTDEAEELLVSMRPHLRRFILGMCSTMPAELDYKEAMLMLIAGIAFEVQQLDAWEEQGIRDPLKELRDAANGAFDHIEDVVAYVRDIREGGDGSPESIEEGKREQQAADKALVNARRIFSAREEVSD